MPGRGEREQSTHPLYGTVNKPKRLARSIGSCKMSGSCTMYTQCTTDIEIVRRDKFKKINVFSKSKYCDDAECTYITMSMYINFSKCTVFVN